MDEKIMAGELCYLAGEVSEGAGGYDGVKIVFSLVG
jgi:hypothetical protein